MKYFSTQEIATKLNCVRSTILIHMKLLGCRPKKVKAGRNTTFFWTEKQLREVARIPKFSKLEKYDEFDRLSDDDD